MDKKVSKGRSMSTFKPNSHLRPEMKQNDTEKQNKIKIHGTF